jgi:hypothetical protein
MKEDLIADLWHVVIGHVPEKQRPDVATDFVNTLLDYGIKESVLDGLRGVDSFLDEAIEYAIDGEEIEEDVDSYDEEE